MKRRVELARLAAHEALRLRKSHELDLCQAISVYDLAEQGLGLSVYFDAIPSMEGMYFDGKVPRIFLSSLRPSGRMAYTCAHEIAHHVFGHGARVDDQVQSLTSDCANSEEEYLAESFAGFLLMPKLAISHGFVRRDWDITQATPGQLYVIACWLGVGYSTLVWHMKASVKLLHRNRADELVKVPLKQIRRDLVGTSLEEPLIVVDRQWFGRPIDVQVGDYLLFQHAVENESGCLEEISVDALGQLFRATAPGIGRIAVSGDQWAEFVRVSRRGYVGQCQYRHLEEPLDEC